jgi:hypothetical protein
MKVELIISKERVSYIVNALGKERVTVSEHNEEQKLISFELDSQLDFLYMFHAGVSYGSESMSRALVGK